MNFDVLSKFILDKSKIHSMHFCIRNGYDELFFLRTIQNSKPDAHNKTMDAIHK
ncbi:MAG: hypothetical protein RL641_114 [Candidatus Parcubacteria bacterium]|jgi:hypothetical protein